MGQVFSITKPMDTVFSPGGSQSLDEVVDVSAFDELAIYSIVSNVYQPVSFSMSFNLWSGMSLNDTNDWASIVTHNLISAEGPIAIDVFKSGGFRRYIGWNISYTGASSVTLLITGVGRTYAR